MYVCVYVRGVGVRVGARVPVRARVRACVSEIAGLENRSTKIRFYCTEKRIGRSQRTIFHTKNTKAQEEICFIVGRQLSIRANYWCASSYSTYHCDSYTHTYNIINHGNLTTVISTLPPVTSTLPPVTTQSLTPQHFTTTLLHKRSSSQRPTRTSLRIRNRNNHDGLSNKDLIMISHHNIRGYNIHKAELQASLEDHSPDVVTLN